MLKRNKEGLYYVSETSGKLYFLHKGTSLGGDKEYTDDIVYIMDSGFTEENYAKWMDGEIERTDDNVEELVNFFYGATFVEHDLKESEEIIKILVDKYESKKKYSFTNDGIYSFVCDIEEMSYDEVVVKMQNGKKPDEDKLAIKIQVGNHHITVPYTNNNYINLHQFLIECKENTVEIKPKSIEEQILDTLCAYKTTNEEYLEQTQIKNLNKQIEYMKNQIKEGK